ncbi:hypothetical protein EVAR_96994_1 [Eumeta japonica]|uniref:Uncharacterized protein n=1 Tax=Eumeta variegata TaxID=151549 RepID=A0A4C1VEM1_EUMVA|nr:hypothetical protein EVAR_96994_1 [Eumeta japonica]
MGERRKAFGRPLLVRIRALACKRIHTKSVYCFVVLNDFSGASKGSLPGEAARRPRAPFVVTSREYKQEGRFRSIKTRSLRAPSLFLISGDLSLGLEHYS